jgi:hypothetical protein
MVCDYFKSRPQLEAEIVILRHQLNLLQRRAPRRPHLRWVDRALFIWLYRRCPRVLRAITIVRPDGELLKLGIEIAQSTVSIYMVPRSDRPLQTWKTFLCNHMEGIASIAHPRHVRFASIASEPSHRRETTVCHKRTWRPDEHRAAMALDGERRTSKLNLVDWSKIAI